MFDIGATEILLIVIVAILAIGPKDMPAALRGAGRWVAKIRRTSAHFRAGFDTMVREAELEEMEKEWKDINAQIMAQSPDADSAPDAASAEARSEMTGPVVPDSEVTEVADAPMNEAANEVGQEAGGEAENARRQPSVK